jgi:hypothetical protein
MSELVNDYDQFADAAKCSPHAFTTRIGRVRAAIPDVDWLSDRRVDILLG